jgi:lipopolysaccharide export system permease protein
MGNYIIPHANQRRFIFEEQYYHKVPKGFRGKNVHKQIEPGIYVYLETYNARNNTGRRFSLEKFEKGQLVSKLISQEISWDSTKNCWNIHDYYIRDYIDQKQLIRQGKSLDTVLKLQPKEFSMRDNEVEAMNLGELNRFISNQQLQGSTKVSWLLVERNKRFSFPFSTFILTLIGVSVSSRKVKGGIGMHIGIGLVVSFSYIFFLQFSTQYAVSGAMSPFAATWLPNVLFAFVAFLLYRLALNKPAWHDRFNDDDQLTDNEYARIKSIKTLLSCNRFINLVPLFRYYSNLKKNPNLK